MSLDDLGFLDQQPGRAVPKGQSRLEAGIESRRLTLVDEKAFRAAVIARDGYVCRCCGSKVVKTIANVPLRLEIHHIHGRLGELAFEPRAALVLCNLDHSRVTGRVNERLIIVPSKTFTLDSLHLRGVVLTDASWPVEFRKIA